LQGDDEIVDAGHLIGIFRRGLGKARVRRAEDRIVNEKSRVLLPIDDQKRHTSHESVTHVEHAVRQTRIGMQTDDGRLAGHESVAGGDTDRARFVQRQDIGRA